MILAPLWRDFFEFLGHQEKFKGCIFKYTHIQKKVGIHPRHHCLGMWMVDPISWFKALMKGWVGQEIILDSFGLGIKTFKLSKNCCYASKSFFVSSTDLLVHVSSVRILTGCLSHEPFRFLISMIDSICHFVSNINISSGHRFPGRRTFFFGNLRGSTSSPLIFRGWSSNGWTDQNYWCGAIPRGSFDDLELGMKDD